MPWSARREEALRKEIVLLVLTTLAALPGLQAQSPRGSVRGTVQDATGARIPAAKISAQALDSSMVRKATSEDRGEFRIDDLLPGNYHITVAAAGFAPAQADVVISVSSVRDVTVTLNAFCTASLTCGLVAVGATSKAYFPTACRAVYFSVMSGRLSTSYRCTVVSF